jgi:hypothetical protein
MSWPKLHYYYKHLFRNVSLSIRPIAFIFLCKGGCMFVSFFHSSSPPQSLCVCNIVRKVRWHSHSGEYEDGIALMTEATSSSEMLVNFYQATWRYNPEDSHLHCLENSTLWGQSQAQQVIKIQSAACQSWERVDQNLSFSAMEGEPSTSESHVSSVFDDDNPEETKQEMTCVVHYCLHLLQTGKYITDHASIWVIVFHHTQRRWEVKLKKWSSTWSKSLVLLKKRNC